MLIANFSRISSVTEDFYFGGMKDARSYWKNLLFAIGILGRSLASEYLHRDGGDVIL